MPQQYLKIIFYFFPLLIIAQNVDPVALEDTISDLNDQHQYESSILILEDIIQNPDSDSFDKTHAYIQKAFTYKRVYNYVMAITNLNRAEVEAQNSSKKEELESKIWAEKMLVYFDMQEGDNILIFLDKLTPERVSHLTRETLAHYYTVLGYMASWKKDYKKSAEKFDLAISILKQDNPKHLPNIYRAKLSLYSAMGDYGKVLQAFEEGLSYAEKYDVEIYDIIMHEGLTKHYNDIGDYKKAFDTQKIVSAKREKYNANNTSDALLNLENKLAEQRRNLEMEAEKKRQFYLSTILIISIALIIVLLLLLRVSKQKNKLILNENRYIRLEVERLSAAIDVNNSKGILDKHSLTERQLEVIELVKEGKTNKEIGNELYISENTVKYHLKTIYEILDVDNRTDLRNNYA